MRKTIFIIFLVLFITHSGAESIYREIEATARRLLAEMSNSTRSIPYVHQNFFPMTYAMTMNTREFGPTGMFVEEWDGTMWHTLMNWEFEYDAYGNISEYYQTFYGPGYTVIYHYHDITYDTMGRVTELWMELDMGTGYVSGSHEIYEYGSTWLDYYFLEGDYGIGSYHNQEQAFYTYTEGELTLGFYQNWDDVTQSWVDDYRHTLTYNGGLLSTILYEYYNGNQWENEYYEIFTMLNNVRPQMYINQIWNGSGFDNCERFTYSYSRYEFDERLEEDWNNNTWNYTELQEVTYDNNANPLQVDISLWDGYEWTDHEKYIFEYGPSAAQSNTIPNALNLRNFPNPFNPETTIEFDLNANQAVTLEIFNLQGEIVLREILARGQNSFVWNASDLASGIYFYRIKSGNFRNANKMILLK